MKVIIDISEKMYEDCKARNTGHYSPYDFSSMITNGTPISDNATNGDMIKAMFPLIRVKEKNNGYEVYFGIGTAIQFFNHRWWNASYDKRG